MTDNTPEEWIRLLTDALQRAEALGAKLDHEQANTRPAPRKWSVAECIEHLNQSMKIYLSAMKAGAAKAQEAAGTEHKGRGTLYGRLIINNLRKGPQKRKFPALPMFKPREQDEWQMEDVLKRFKEHTEELLKLIEDTKGKDINKPRHKTPIPLTRITLAQSLELHTLHNQRHITQAENTLL
jgi:hypothetical protein